MALILLFRSAAGPGLMSEGSVEFVRRELARMGPTTRAQRNVFAVFALTVVLWAAPGAIALIGVDETAFGRMCAASVPESVAAILGAALLFVLPVDWRARTFTDLGRRGENRLGRLTAVWRRAGNGRAGVSDRPREGDGRVRHLVASGADHPGIDRRLLRPRSFSLCETTSNTASANMIVPITIAVAQAAGVRPIEPALGAALGASMGFMMPISTPPNAIVYSSGYVPIGQIPSRRPARHHRLRCHRDRRADDRPNSFLRTSVKNLREEPPSRTSVRIRPCLRASNPSSYRARTSVARRPAPGLYAQVSRGGSCESHSSPWRVAAGAVAAATVLGISISATTLRPDFIEEPFVSGLTNPTAMAFAPDGRLFVCQSRSAARDRKRCPAADAVPDRNRQFVWRTRPAWRGVRS